MMADGGGNAEWVITALWIELHALARCCCKSHFGVGRDLGNATDEGHTQPVEGANGIK